MTVAVGKYEFEGPYASADHLEDRAGVYLIVDSVGSNYVGIDCGESATVRSRVENHDRRPCWEYQRSGTLMVAVLYTPDLPSAGRAKIEHAVRGALRFPCGQR